MIKHKSRRLRRDFLYTMAGYGLGIERGMKTIVTLLAAMLAAVEAYGAKLIYDYSIIPGIAIRIPEGKDIRDAINYFKKVQGVTAIERDQIIHLTDPVQPTLERM